MSQEKLHKEQEKDLFRMLMRKAIEARKKSYSPYSGFAVGAALLTKNQSIYTGCNIENAAYSASVCAERTAILKAASDGNCEFQAIAIVGGPVSEDILQPQCPPCGVCRQVMMEFVGDDETFTILLGDSEENYHCYSLAELLPYGFGPKNLS